MEEPTPDLATSVRRKSRRIVVLASVLAPLLAGCTVTEPPSIISTMGRLPEGHAVQMPEVEADGSLRASFGRALDAALATHSIETTSEAPLVAAFAIAVRDGQTGVADPAASNAESVIWESTPRPNGLFDNCDGERLRATLVLLDRSDGEIVYRGVGESTECEIGEDDIVDLANVLVVDASKAVTSN
ncbi:hypothetical protein [Erythrobacter alti]|uniref:hypothetical protein n=1 Tax=Erythrobacter alti TaxID=1896145 RepID=UPI0030F489BB